MKVWLVEISDFLPELDAGNRLYRCGMLANALSDAGHELRWWSSTFNHQLRLQRYKSSKSFQIKPNYYLELLYGPGYINSISISRWWHNRIVAREFRLKISSLPTAEYPDLIHACLPTLELSEQAVNFGSRHDIPVVVDIRDQWPEIYTRLVPRKLRPFMQYILYTEFRRAKNILKKASAITAVSRANLNWGLSMANRAPESRHRYFPLGFPSEQSELEFYSKDDLRELATRYGIRKGYLVVTFVGSFTGAFDFNSLLQAASYFFKHSEHKVQFVLIGDGKQALNIRKRLDGIDNVVMPGWCNKQTVVGLLMISSIGLAPYSSSALITLPNKPFEYIAAGLPLLSSLKGELEEMIKRESIGIQYNADDPHELKDKILWCLRNPDELKDMGRRAKNLLAREYDADKIYKDFANHLCKVAGKTTTFYE